MKNTAFKRYAFISYNHHDVLWADWLRKSLEKYKLPEHIENEFNNSRFLRPVFRDKDDLNAGILGEELTRHLETSKYLVVICSPNSAKSAWVSNEVNYFIKHERLQNIIPFIVSGEPNSGDEKECFPQSLREFVKQHPEQELLGVNVQEVGRKKALVRVVSRILGIDFDNLWKRDERAKKKRVATISITSIIASILLAFLAIPVQMSVQISEPTHNLPKPEQIILTVNGTEYPLYSTDTLVELTSLPGYFKGRTIPLSLVARYYDTIIQKEKIPFSLSNTIDIDLQRDSTFAVYSGIVVDEDGNPLKDVIVSCETKETLTDELGRFRLTFALEEQTLTKKIILRKHGYIDGGRIDESPNLNLSYLLKKER